MDQLISFIEATRAKLDRLRRHELKETPTRTIVIDPALEALGWDVRDPDEVQLEYPTIDGKSVDYALKLNKKPAVLVEAKALNDPLDSVKAVTQVTGYASNDGIVWCVLTNGVKWKVYRSIEECPAPDKLMFEVSLDPRDGEGVAVQQIAQQMWRFSRNELAKGTLDALGEQTFTDGKVRKALHTILRSPPRQVVNAIRKACGDDALSPQSVRQSLARIVGQITGASSPQVAARAEPNRPLQRKPPRGRGSQATAGEKGSYTEAQHTAGKPQEVLGIYRAIDQFCLSLDPGHIQKRVLAKYIAYRRGKPTFCSLHLQQGGLRLWLKLKYAQTTGLPSFARDVSNVGHWGVRDLELGVSSLSQVPQVTELIQRSFESQS